MKTTIIRPIITEKTMRLSQRNWYTFMVAKDVSKKEVASAISHSYNVKVVDVRTVNVPGKMKRAGKKMRYITKEDWKKAMVLLSPGQTIAFFDVVTDEANKTK